MVIDPLAIVPAFVMFCEPILSAPVIVPPASGSLVAIELVTVVEKLASSPNAAASSLSVFKVLGELSTRFAIAVVT